MLNFVAMDLETTGLNCWQDEIIEIGLVKYVDGQETDRFQTLVRPRQPLPVRIKRLTGLQDEDFSTAPLLQEILPEVLSFIDRLPLVGHNIKFDGNFLSAAAGQTIANPLFDTLELAQYLLPSAPSHRLGDLCHNLGLPLEQQHRALDDALGAARLLLALLERLSGLEAELVWQLSQLLKQAASPWHPVLEKLSVKILKQFPDRKLTYQAPGARPVEVSVKERQPQAAVPVTLEECMAVLGPAGNLSEALPRFQYRPQQCDMAARVVTALNESKYLLVEAGTGTGKSLAYLVPAICWAVKNSQRVLISTHTITLQEQLWHKDLPLLTNLAGFKFTAALMKGRSNYLCLRRWHLAMSEQQHQPEEAGFLAKVMLWLHETGTGDKSELVMSYQEQDYWAAVCSESEGCLSNRCPYFKEKCFFMAARRQADRADLVVVNHSLLLSDANADNRVLPSYGPLIIDEAHHLESCATEHLGSSSGRSEVLRWLAAAGKQLSKLDGFVITDHQQEWLNLLRQSAEIRHQCREAANSFFEMLARWIENSAVNYEGRWAVRFGPADNRDEVACLPAALDSALDNLLVQLLSLSRLMVKLAERLSEATVFTDDLPAPARELAALAAVGEGIAHNLERICRHHEDDYVYWVEGSGQRSELALRAAPIDVGPLLRAKLFAETRPVILTSATITVDGSFKHFAKSIGLDVLPADKIIEKQLASPFNYAKQALLCAANDIQPVQTGDNHYHDELARAVYNISMAAQGRTLVLFTSHRSLREVYHRLKDPCERADLCLLGHELDGSRRRLVEQFAAGQRTVLLGAASFWEGVDIPGEALSCVIIVKLPFAPPNHPLLEARLQKIARQGRNGFRDYQIPHAVIKFKQGFGRLIRDAGDKGVVVILDSRLVEKKYGAKFFNSLPLGEHFRGSWQQIVHQVKAWLGSRKE
ncbi:helicase C-terminal domain-containing protein [Desulforamulus hydrothermalis]|uniref:3'-5' exonuclease DinG n=1 Tax=Desulforamulus hydrothermalis Lam5 = DSM 18033 TaxID=1121428 RepID=K8EEA9_9FIRM|nr:helicase C-terminal domain-containing protein [Desulforamulus hydrothermalis]CCO07131.1 DnaQ family exonuclease/DinG family helicase [Desulforamulus hydrothermalis Lam5 = DSM 18033]SHG89411.1 ATP-dependent DNA helicase DinG [Desulforamulus hydrothermalis Lam5 = DSM 18033]